MAVNGSKKVSSDIDGILRQPLEVLLETGDGEVSRLWLVGVKEELDSMDSRITPVDLATPLELGRVVLIV